MKQRFSDLIEVAKVQRLTDLFYTATGIPASVIDLDGTVITGSGWQEICTNFHRVNDETRERCIESDTVIANQIGAGQKYTVFGCKNGLIDAATPIAIEGEHVANFFTGQFLFHAPERDFFQEQARRFGFDEAAYMEAVAKIPIIDEARLQPFLECFAEFAAMLGEMGLKHLKQIEAAAALRESEQRWATTLSSVGDAVIATDKDTRITFMNTVAEGLTGWSLSEAAAKPITEVFSIINERTREAVDNPVTKVLQKGMIVGLANHTVLISKDGKEIPIDDSGAPIRDAAGNTVGVVLVFRDITERKTVEERASHLASFPQLNPNPVMEVDASGEMTFCNPGTLRVLEGVGMDRADCHSFLPRDLKAILDQWDREHESTLQREVSLNNRVFAETVHLVPQFGVARIYAHDVTERTEAEEKLIQAKEEWERTFAAVPDMVAIIDNEHRILRVNEAMAGRLGRKAEECVGLRCFEAIHGSSEPPDFCPHAKSLKDGLQHIEEVHEERLRGDFLVSTTPLHDQEGRMIGTVHVAHDITERKAAEERLRESEELYRNIVETATEGIWIGDTEARTTFVNKRMADMLGYTPEELSGRVAYDFMDAEARVLAESKFEERLDGLRGSYEQKYIRKDGTTLWALTSGAPLRDKDGRVVASLAILADVTDQKRAEEALQEAYDGLEQRVRERTAELRSLIEASLDPLVTIDREGKISDVNAGTELVTGCSREELIGTDFADYFTEPEKARQGYEQVFAEESVRDYPLDIRHRDGRVTPVLYNASVYRDDAGSVIGVFAAARDVSERQKLEAQLRQAQKMEALGTLSGGIAHDFNNILAAIIGFTELVADHLGKGNREERHVRRILEASLRGRDLVRQLLAFSRKAEQEKKPLRVNSIVKETVRLVRASTPTTVSITTRAASDSGLIFADPTQVQQVLMNLCANAAYAMRAKGGVLDIEISNVSISPSEGSPHGIEPGPYVKLTVRDTGTGIPPEIVEKIFDPFFTTKGLGEGTGLGLAVVHGIVKQSNGYITAESEPGKGSTFTVYFPEISEEQHTEGPEDATIPTGSERILFVDDEEALIEMGEDILAELGYEVTSRMNGKEALSLLKEDPSRFDLVVTDVTMPEITGVDLARQALAIRPDLPIIMCTGFSHLVNADTAKAAGIRAFIMKPLTKREIAKTIRQVLDE